MNRIRFFIWFVPLMLISCQSVSDKDTIAKLRHMQIEIKEEKIEGGLDKAMASYQSFLQETPDSALTPEAIRRLADLKIEKEYGTLTQGPESAGRGSSPALSTPEYTVPAESLSVNRSQSKHELANIPIHFESDEIFEKRTTEEYQVRGIIESSDGSGEKADDLERAGALEAIELYKKLLKDYPLYERNDQVLYQMCRAYEELGKTKEALAVMDRLVTEFPGSRYIDEVQFRRAEYFFTHRRYMDAEDAYGSVVKIGVGSYFYELALYKLGWTFYKQELYEDSLHRFIALMDHKVSTGYDFEQIEDEQERKRTEDTFRVTSLSFSNLGGSDSVVDYFSHHGKRSYEDKIYSNLAEFYFDKRRYADAAAAYNAFITRNPLHKVAPNFHMRVIEIQAAGGFPTLVLDSKKDFAKTYGLKSEYWSYFDPKDRPDVLGYLKTNLTDLANHYHACYQDSRQADMKPANFEEALNWYREFLASFPMDAESPAINYQLADLLLENQSYGAAALEFEKTAYNYPTHEKSSQAGYAALLAYREQLGIVEPGGKYLAEREVVRSSLKFADIFPEHEKAGIVLGAAADDLYGMKEYEEALVAAKKLLEKFPGTDVDVLRAAWLVIGHSSFELNRYSEAETAYVNVLALLPADDKTRNDLVDNLAASIYKQGEQANSTQEYRIAADHFLRVGRMAPTSQILPAAEYDAAAALILLKDWEMASAVLVKFRQNFPDHQLQPEVTKKMAYVYRENGQLSLAAEEYERIEKESDDDDIRRDALLVAAELHEKDGNSNGALEVYRRYVDYFQQPVDLNLETRNKIAEILKEQNDMESYLAELENMVTIDASAQNERTSRTLYLVSRAALVLAEKSFEEFLAVKLETPFEVNLHKKRERMKTATNKFNQLVDYEIAEITAAATFYLAEIYAHFSNALLKSERPTGLDALEKEQYELAIEDQAYPFEEKAIEVHQNNLKLISLGIYNVWIEKSMEKLAEFLPARYDKPEETGIIVSSLDTYVYEIERPVPQEQMESETPGPAPFQETESLEETQSLRETESFAGSKSPAEPDPEEPGLFRETEPLSESDSEEPAPVQGLQSDTESPPVEREPGNELEPIAEPLSLERGKVDEPAPDVENEPADEPIAVDEPETDTESEPMDSAQTDELSLSD